MLIQILWKTFYRCRFIPFSFVSNWTFSNTFKQCILEIFVVITIGQNCQKRYISPIIPLIFQIHKPLLPLIFPSLIKRFVCNVTVSIQSVSVATNGGAYIVTWNGTMGSRLILPIQVIPRHWNNVIKSFGGDCERHSGITWEQNLINLWRLSVPDAAKRVSSFLEQCSYILLPFCESTQHVWVLHFQKI